jgi:hypothetical protein
MHSHASTSPTTDEEVERTLRREWGPTYERRIHAVKTKAVPVFFPGREAEAREMLNRTGLGNNLTLIRETDRVLQMLAHETR